MKVLVIGGTGLISGATTKHLKSLGHQVTVYHRGSSPLKTRGVEEIIGDKMDRRAFEADMKKRRFDAVIDPLLFNAQDAASDMRAFAGRIKHFIFISTVGAIGGPPVCIPADETEPYRPVGDYGRNKAAAEKMLLKAWRTKKFPVTIVRPSHTYGPNNRIALGTFVTDWGKDCELFNRIRQGKHVVLHGDGEGLWQSCYVDDLAEGLGGILKRRRKTLGEIYHMCGHEVMSWNEYYHRIGTALGRKVKIVHVPSDAIYKAAPEHSLGFLREFASMPGVYDISKAKAHIPEFNPRIPVEKGMARLYKWLKKEGALKEAPKRPFEDRLVRLGLQFLKKAGRE